MNPLKQLLLLALLLSVGFLSAQNTFENVYNKEVIGFYGDTRFIRNGEILKRKQIVPLLLKYEASALQYKFYKKHKRIANGLQIGMAIMYLSSIGFAATNTGAALGTFGLGFGASVAALPMRLEARKHLQQAVYLYNMNVLAESAQTLDVH